MANNEHCTILHLKYHVFGLAQEPHWTSLRVRLYIILHYFLCFNNHIFYVIQYHISQLYVEALVNIIVCVQLKLNYSVTPEPWLENSYFCNAFILHVLPGSLLGQYSWYCPCSTVLCVFRYY